MTAFHKTQTSNKKRSHNTTENKPLQTPTKQDVANYWLYKILINIIVKNFVRHPSVAVSRHKGRERRTRFKH